LHYQWTFLLLFGASLIAFVFVVIKNQSLVDRLLFEETLEKINHNEDLFLQGKYSFSQTGEKFAPPHHAYAQDLDIFGENSLFQYLHRGGTSAGEWHLAQSLLTVPELEKIIAQQETIKEVTPWLDWRQNYLAHAQLSNDSETKQKKLEQWAALRTPALSKVTRFFSYALPFLFIAFLILYFVSANLLYLRATGLVFTLQLALIASHVRTILNEVNAFDDAKETLLHYTALLEMMEKQAATSHLFREKQTQLGTSTDSASALIRQLQSYTSSLSNVQNLFGAVVFNGFGSYHLRLFHRYQIWKEKHAPLVHGWIQTIGEVELWVVQANFAFNNPTFTYPTWHTERSFELSNVSHPFIPSSVRVGNSIFFDKEGMVILTGSNMSGKSTFLRTLGINFILAQAGMPVCADRAHLSLKKIIVSMRLNDSLADQKSYFFAEILRLKTIMDQLDESSFLLLDELLRGTNSDDKRLGTIGLLHRLRERGVQGILATHDLEVCGVSAEQPTYFRNACFEVEINDTALHFDYLLREGICKNKNASHLLKKYGIIA
jgi:hypothetical protein